MGELNVRFQIDTDNRDNFPSTNAFAAFKLQRDKFYEILSRWEKDHLISRWNFQTALCSKIQNMLTLHDDAINYYHFAKLFKSQLLISCIQNRQHADVEDDESISVLKALKDVNPKKLGQLKSRLVTPQHSENQITGPSFPGIQEFFKDFILYANNPFFYVHLENCLVHEIMELNDTQFNGSEIEDSDTTTDEQTQQNFITCLSSLRLLAKVLGLVVSLPYRSTIDNFEDLVATQIEVRSKVLPVINLHNCLYNAIALGKVSLTVPWVAKYLAMMDSVTLRLPYYKQTLELLHHIYEVVTHSKFSVPDSTISEQAANLLKFTLGWLFELPNLPKDLYPTWENNLEIKKVRNLKQLGKYHMQKNSLIEELAGSITSSNYNLDKLNIINERTLRACCPFVALKPCETNKNTNLSNSHSNKHIKPVSSQLDKSAKSAGMEHLELQLEDSFFHGQPASIRETVDFVSKRVASTYVKHICNTLLVSFRETNLNTFNKILKEKQSERLSEKSVDDELNDITDLEACMESEINTLATNASKELTEQCEASLPAFCEIRITKSIESLLAEDSSASVKEMCVKIAMRLATERIHQWIQSHIVGGALFARNMKIALNRFPNNITPLEAMEEKEHNPSQVLPVTSPTTIINNLRELMWNMLDNYGESLTVTAVSTVLDNLYQILEERAGLLAGPEKILYSLSIDFALLLVAHRSDLFTSEVQEKLIKVWTMSRWKVLGWNSLIYRILSSRNVMLLAHSKKEEIWPVLGKFIKRLIKENVLDINSFSDQCVALFRQDWPAPILKHLSKCLTEVTTDLEASDESAEKAKYLLGWIAGTYSEIGFCDDYNPID